MGLQVLEDGALGDVHPEVEGFPVAVDDVEDPLVQDPTIT